jgi:hypothetical protein
MTFLDSNRQDFIGTMCGLGDGETIERKRDRQVHTSHNALPSKVIIDVPQPLMINSLPRVRWERQLSQQGTTKLFGVGVHSNKRLE